jgi:hypothetical protein
VELHQLNSLSEDIVVFAFLFLFFWSSVDWFSFQVNNLLVARILRWSVVRVVFQVKVFLIAVQVGKAIWGALDYLIWLFAWIVDDYVPVLLA